MKHVKQGYMIATVLKKGHSMTEKNEDLLPIIKKVAGQTDVIPVTDLAGLRVDRCLSSYSEDELSLQIGIRGMFLCDANTEIYMTGYVLFQKHTLIETSLRPVIRKTKQQREKIPDADLARLTEDRNLSSYTIEELSMEFEGLTGWPVEIVLSQAHQKRNLQNMRHIVHFTILQANEVGVPPSKVGVVLKKGHSLKGKSLDPAQGEIISGSELARLERD